MGKTSADLSAMLEVFMDNIRMLGQNAPAMQAGGCKFEAIDKKKCKITPLATKSNTVFDAGECFLVALKNPNGKNVTITFMWLSGGGSATFQGRTSTRKSHSQKVSFTSEGELIKWMKSEDYKAIRRAGDVTRWSCTVEL